MSAIDNVRRTGKKTRVRKGTGHADKQHHGDKPCRLHVQKSVVDGAATAASGPLATGRSDQPAERSWQKGWDLDARRFIAHKWRSVEDEGGELWRVVDVQYLAVFGYADTKQQASLIAGALEFLSLHSTADEFNAGDAP